MKYSRNLLFLALVLGVGCEGDIQGPSDESHGIDDNDPVVDPGLAAVAQSYFPSENALPSGKRLFRLTREQLDITTQTLLPAHYLESALGTLPRDPLEKNYEYSQNLGFNPANFTPYVSWVSSIVQKVREAPEGVIDCASSNNSPACLASEAKRFVARAFRGVTSDAVLARYSEFYLSSVAAVGFADATADLVDLTLTSPSYVFRNEVTTDAANALLPAAALQNISYTLADAPPETVGLTSESAAAHVATAEATQATIEQVLASAEARAKLTRFFSAWLELRQSDELGISESVFPEFTPEVAQTLVQETRTFLQQMLSAALPKLEDLTESTHGFVSAPTAFIYGQPASTGPIELDPTQRLGIFTQPAVIASHSGPTTTRLVKRGVFFTRKVLCLPLGAPPPGVDTSVPETENLTERQKIEGMTTPPTCAGCHAYINPFGFMQENYDAIGRFRTTDNGLPIDASISVDFLDEGPLSASSPVEAFRGLTRSLRFQQCFTRQLFRFYMGRDEQPGDDPLLERMFLRFAGADRDILGLLRTLASSPSFGQRLEAP